MTVPKDAVWERDPHTAAKHDLLKRYLEAWAPILLSRNDVITYAEGFAGAGVYKQGEPGSPVVAYEVFARALSNSQDLWINPVGLVLVSGATSHNASNAAASSAFGQ
ncbi:three-Cys-motif partner protein TcmP [Streptomyces mirabilis]|uniref:three-Cys-motif partner protein TcmP n=1 Tax=Streptomyces mirabilis TaxID=68239 RepID=UPI0036D19DEE